MRSEVVCVCVCAHNVFKDGGLYAWGGNPNGETGLRTPAPVLEPTLNQFIPKESGGVLSIAVSQYSAVCVTVSGEAFMWGETYPYSSIYRPGQGTRSFRSKTVFPDLEFNDRRLLDRHPRSHREEQACVRRSERRFVQPGVSILGSHPRLGDRERRARHQSLCLPLRDGTGYLVAIYVTSHHSLSL